jgi:DNA repair protein RadA/Sms
VRASGRDASAGFRCGACGAQTLKWAGRCPRCQTWGTIEARSSALRAPLSGAARRGGDDSVITEPARSVLTIDEAGARFRPTGIGEFDRVLGGGLVPGAVVLLAGEPGIGKSTLLLDVAAKVASAERRSLVVTGEESAAQVRLRASRIGALREELWLATETDLDAVLSHLEQVRPALLVLDSVQTITTRTAEGAAGGSTQIREVTLALIRAAKALNMTCLIVGHVTKDGAVAGPKLLEHLVDVVLHFEGDRHSTLRLVRASKNRFGPSDEVGCFEMADAGIRAIADPSGLFLSRSAGGAAPAVPGTCVTVAIEGRRPLVAEVQALVAPPTAAFPRRATSGLDTARVAMVLAVIERHLGITVGRSDVYAATVGGVRVGEPAADLAVALATVSCEQYRAVPADVVAIGEVGLAGEVRLVGGVRQRLAAAARLGFRRALVPLESGAAPEGIATIEVADLAGAVATLWDIKRKAG